MKLIRQINDCSDQFTYEFYLEQFPIFTGKPPWQEWTYSIFSDNKKVLSNNIIEKDIAELTNIAIKVNKYIDRSVAHLDKRGNTIKLTYNDLTNSVNCFNRITCKYLALITSEGYPTLRPTIQSNWKRIFSLPFDIRKNDHETN